MYELIKLDVIIVDDQTLDWTVTKKVIETSPLSGSIKIFGNVDDALAYIQASHLVTNKSKRKTLIISDVMMPGKDGWKFADTFNQLNLDDYIFCLLSATVDVEYHFKVKNRSWILSLFEKPLNKETFVGFLQKIRKSLGS
jgi:response regulator RpfG family c-di-GMP phosphodiesterase